MGVFMSIDDDFRAAVEDAGEEFQIHAHLAMVHFKEAKRIADAYGLPFFTYIPDSFYGKFWKLDDETIGNHFFREVKRGERCVSVDLVASLIPMDPAFWESSNTECEVLGPHG